MYACALFVLHKVDSHYGASRTRRRSFLAGSCLKIHLITRHALTPALSLHSDFLHLLPSLPTAASTTLSCSDSTAALISCYYNNKRSIARNSEEGTPVPLSHYLTILTGSKVSKVADHWKTDITREAYLQLYEKMKLVSRHARRKVDYKPV